MLGLLDGSRTPDLETSPDARMDAGRRLLSLAGGLLERGAARLPEVQGVRSG
jgi:hypothetical protein